MMRATLFTAALVAAAASARAQAPTTATTASATAAPPASPQQGIAVGVELGEPTSATIGWWNGKLGVSGALGTGTAAGVGLSLHADVQYEVARLTPSIPVRLGLGGRYYHHGYDPMSFDEVPHSHYGIRATVAIAYERGAMQLYAELAPGVDFHRTASCTLASGPYTVCPHAQELPLFVQLVVGARWFLSR